MKFKRLPKAVILTAVGALSACSGGLPERLAHKDEPIYSFTDYETGKTTDGLTWKDSYDAIIKKTKTTSGDLRNRYLHQAEDVLMSTGAITPVYYYTDVFMKSGSMDGFYSSPLGYKFFQKAKVGASTEFTVCVGPKGDSFDPAINSAVDGAIVISHVYEGLYRWAKPEVGEVAADLEPAQAASFVKVPGNDGHVKYTFTLRSGLKYSDGSDLKASDFAKSWARAASGKLAADYGYMFDCIVGYEATAADDTQYLPLSGIKANDDARTLEVELVSDVPYFLELTAFPTYAPVKLANVQNEDGTESDDWWTKTDKYIGNGPMKVTEMDNQEGGKIVFAKNDNYWDNANTVCTKLTMALTEDDGNQYTNFKSGAYAFVDSIPNEKIEVEKDNPEYHVNGQLGTYYLIWNVNDNTLNKFLHTEYQYMMFRRALSLLIDRNYICEEIGQAGQEPANTFVGKGIMVKHDVGPATEWTADVNGSGYRYYSVAKDDFADNCAQAVRLLRQCGFDYDFETKKFTNIPTIQYLYNTSSGHKAIAEYLQSAYAAYGINIELESQEWAVFLNTRKDGNYSFARNGWLADYNDPCSFLDMWTTDSGNNDAQFGR